MSAPTAMDADGDGRPAPRGRVLAAALLVAACGAAWGLVRHPGFQPVFTLRVAAPAIALVAGGFFVRLVALWRMQADGEREFDPAGKALTMGLVMVLATLLAWLLVSQALPATWTAATGVARTEAGVVARKVPEVADPDCRFRLEVASAASAAGAVPRPYDECVGEAVWRQAVAGGPVSLRLVGGALGAELVGVDAAVGVR